MRIIPGIILACFVAVFSAFSASEEQLKGGVWIQTTCVCTCENFYGPTWVFVDSFVNSWEGGKDFFKSCMDEKLIDNLYFDNGIERTDTDEDRSSATDNEDSDSSDTVVASLNMATSNTRLITPTYVTGQSYELYKKELTIWQNVINIEKKSQALHVLLALPNKDKDKEVSSVPHDLTGIYDVK